MGLLTCREIKRFAQGDNFRGAEPGIKPGSLAPESMLLTVAPCIRQSKDPLLGVLNWGTGVEETLLRWLSHEESANQCRRCRVNPWVRKVPWNSKWQPTPVFLPRKFSGQRILAGYSSRSHKESDMTDQLSAHTYTPLRSRRKLVRTMGDTQGILWSFWAKLKGEIITSAEWVMMQ